MLIDKRSVLWPKPCVYALFFKGELQYIGQTVNLPGRLASHGKGGIEYDLVWYEDVKQKDLNRVETWLLLQMRPPHNVRLYTTVCDRDSF